MSTLIADGMFVVRASLKEKRSTFALFAWHILINYGFGLCFDIYESPSIKDIKRKWRGDTDLESIDNFSSRQSLPTDFAELLKTCNLKTEFLRFLFKEYEDAIFGPIIGQWLDKMFYCPIDNECKNVY